MILSIFVYLLAICYPLWRRSFFTWRIVSGPYSGHSFLPPYVHVPCSEEQGFRVTQSSRDSRDSKAEVPTTHQAQPLGFRPQLWAPEVHCSSCISMGVGAGGLFICHQSAFRLDVLLGNTLPLPVQAFQGITREAACGAHLLPPNGPPPSGGLGGSLLGDLHPFSSSLQFSVAQ